LVEGSPAGFLAGEGVVPTVTGKGAVAKARYKIVAVNASVVELPKAPEYLIKGILDPRSTSIWFGPPGQGKTFLLLHLAYSIAQGREVFGRRVRQADTLYLALEGRGGLDRRVYALFANFGAAPRFWNAPQDLQLLKFDGQKVVANAEHMGALEEFIEQHQIKFVVIDTLNLTLGGADENDNGDMGLLVKAANAIASLSGAHIAFVAHSPKAGIEGGPRGGGAQKGNVDLVVAISGDGSFTATSFPPAGKIKDGSPFKLHFELKPVELMEDIDGEQLVSCVVDEVDAPQRRRETTLSPELLQAFREVVDLFCSREGLVELRPEQGMKILSCVTHKQVNERWIRSGRLAVEGRTPTAVQKDGQRLRNKLRDLGKIGMNRSHVWLLDGLDKDGQQADTSTDK